MKSTRIKVIARADTHPNHQKHVRWLTGACTNKHAVLKIFERLSLNIDVYFKGQDIFQMEEDYVSIYPVVRSLPASASTYPRFTS